MDLFSRTYAYAIYWPNTCDNEQVQYSLISGFSMPSKDPSVHNNDHFFLKCCLQNHLKDSPDPLSLVFPHAAAYSSYRSACDTAYALPQLLLYPFYSLLYPFRWYSFQIFFLIILYLLSLRNQKPACPSNLVFILAFCLFFFQFLLYTKT